MRTASLLLFIVWSLSAVSSSFALEPNPDVYGQGPVRIDDHAELWYGVDIDSRTAYLAVRVKDSEVVAETSKTWISLGVSEPTSGSMLGADVVTAEYIDDLTCTVTDRYVPFFAYPLGETTPDSPSAFPFPDDCQDDDSWIVEKCERDFEAGEMILEVSRSLDAHDTQDRDIVEGLNSIIYAYGNSFEYHGGNRGGIKVVLYEKDMASDGGPITAEPDLPDDVDGSFTVLATNYTVPSNMTTTYSCTSMKVDLGENSKRMIIAAEPVLNAPIDMVHHFTLYLCREEAYLELTKETTTCMSLNGINGPLANPAAGCSTFVFGYAKGTSRIVLPIEAGILVNGEKQILVMETHFDNHDLIEGNIDNSGVKVYYTDTMREHEAGSLLIGDSMLGRFGDVVKTDFEYENTCPSECTSKFKKSINIYSSLSHMHTTGKEIYTNVHAKNETYLRNMNKVNFWSDRFQMAKIFDPPFVLKAGEQLQTTCIFDTSKRPETKFGLETTDEMCMDFIGYWPLQRDPDTGDEINICAYFRDEEKNTSTVCGDNGKISENTILPVSNPKFEDTTGAPTMFGDELETCPTPDPLAPTVTPTPGTTLPVSETTPPVSETNAPVTETIPPTSESTEPTPTLTSSAGSNPSSEPSASPDDDDDACFPASATVTLKDGSSKRMEDVALGDEVMVGKDTYSTVFMFTHKDAGRRFRFVELTTTAGAKVSLTDGHFIYTNGQLVMGKDVRVGDSLLLADGRRSMVQKIEWRMDRGLFNPQTMHGDIVVDGVVASTYTKAVSPPCAHALLTPVRWVYRAFGVDGSALVV